MHILIVGLTWPLEPFLELLIKGLLHKKVKVTLAFNNKHHLSLRKSLKPQSISLYDSKARYHQKIIWFLKYSLLHLVNRPIKYVQLLKAWKSSDYDSRFLFKRLPFYGKYWNLIYFPWNSVSVSYSFLFERSEPVLISCRGAQINIAPHNPRRIEFTKALPSTFEKARRIHCVSNAIAKQGLHYGLNMSKTVIIKPAVDIHFFSPNSYFQNDIFQIVTTGSLIWRKGIEYALLAVSKLKEASIPFRFKIIGDGPERQKILFTIHDLQLQDHINLIGRASPQYIRDALRSSHLFLFSSLSEGIPNSVLEAMACGLPVITTCCGGVEEVITHKVNGIITPLRDPDSQGNYLKELHSDLNLRKNIGKRAREKIEKDHDLNEQVNKFKILMEDIVV